MKRTPLYDFHKGNGHLAEYAGYEMPLWYRGPVEEHLSVRNTCGIFDVSHMGRIIVSGKEAGDFLDYVLTKRCSDAKLLRAQQGFLCDSSGGIIDDIMLFRLEPEKFLLIVNAINMEKDLKWLGMNATAFGVNIEDITWDVPMIAIQGPKALQVMQTLSKDDLASIKRLHAAWVPLYEREVLISRTGYTGEDGCEVYVFRGEEARQYSTKLWEKILDLGKSVGIEPCGLVARDTLRLEAGFCLNGGEITDETSPIEADLKFGLSLDERRFIGKEALLEQMDKGVTRIRVGFQMTGGGVPRQGMDIMIDEKKIGLVTSGTFSPLLRIGIGMGYVPPEYSPIGARIDIMIRGRLIGAEIVKLPFYDEEKYGWRRTK